MRDTGSASSTCTANTVYVVLHSEREWVVDHVLWNKAVHSDNRKGLEVEIETSWRDGWRDRRMREGEGGWERGVERGMEQISGSREGGKEYRIGGWVNDPAGNSVIQTHTHTHTFTITYALPYTYTHVTYLHLRYIKATRSNISSDQQGGPTHHFQQLMRCD